MVTSGTKAKRAAVYLRCSTGNQFTENQRPEVERLIAARGFELVEVYEENVSAAAKSRPEFERMMKDAHRGQLFNVLVVWSLDRLGRSMVGNLQAVLDLDRRGVQVVSVRESWLDSDIGPARQLLLGVMGWVAEQERLRVGERVRAGLDRVRRSGVKLGRPKANVNARVVMTLRAEGQSVRDIARVVGASPSVVQRTIKARNPTSGSARKWLKSRERRSRVQNISLGHTRTALGTDGPGLRAPCLRSI